MGDQQRRGGGHNHERHHQHRAGRIKRHHHGQGGQHHHQVVQQAVPHPNGAGKHRVKRGNSQRPAGQNQHHQGDHAGTAHNPHVLRAQVVAAHNPVGHGRNIQIPHQHRVLRNHAARKPGGDQNHADGEKRWENQAGRGILGKPAAGPQPFRSGNHHHPADCGPHQQDWVARAARPQRRNRNARQHRMRERIRQHGLSTQHQHHPGQRRGERHHRRKQRHRYRKTHMRSPPPGCMAPRRGATIMETSTIPLNTSTMTGPVGTLPIVTDI